MLCAVAKGVRRGVQGDEPGMTGDRQPARRDPMSVLPSPHVLTSSPLATKGSVTKEFGCERGCELGDGSCMDYLLPRNK